MRIHNAIVLVALFYQACTMTMPSEVFTDKLARFQRLVHELKQDNILDGEVLITQNNNVLLHEHSDACAIKSPIATNEWITSANFLRDKLINAAPRA
jgi:hypothetical protein